MKDTAFHVKFVRGIALLLVFYDLKNTHRTRTELAFDRRFDVAEVGKTIFVRKALRSEHT